jgi:hypothetical protein
MIVTIIKSIILLDIILSPYLPYWYVHRKPEYITLGVENIAKQLELGLVWTRSRRSISKPGEICVGRYGLWLEVDHRTIAQELPNAALYNEEKI